MRYLYQQRRKLTPEETAANAAKRAARAKATMTCQCCGRAILANKGLIAHHGYERPGTGWQTSSCMGARYLPFQVNRDRLGDMIEVIKSMIADGEKHLAKVQAEKIGPLFTYRVYDRNRNVPSWERRREKKTVRVTRAWFCTDPYDYDVEGVHGPFLNRVDPYTTFDRLKEQEINAVEYRLKNMREHLAESQKRYDGWKQTHKRDGDDWVAV